MAAPEWLAIDSDAFIDACAQDVWSIGCLIYRMLTGCMAWEAEGSSYQFVMGILQAHRQWVSKACTSWYHLSFHLWPVNSNFHSMATAALHDCNLLQAQQTPRLSLHLLSSCFWFVVTKFWSGRIVLLLSVALWRLQMTCICSLWWHSTKPLGDHCRDEIDLPFFFAGSRSELALQPPRAAEAPFDTKPATLFSDGRYQHPDRADAAHAAS